MTRCRYYCQCTINLMLLVGFTLLALFITSTHAAAAAVVNNHSTSEMVLNYRQAKPGQQIIAMLHIHPKAGWHVYWQNPGDSGLPPEYQWTLPPGITVVLGQKAVEA